MMNFTKVRMIIFCIVFFSAINGFAQWDDQQQDLNNSEFSKMDKDQNGLISCTEMVTYQTGIFNEMDENNDGQVSESEYTAYYNSSH